VTGSVEVLPLIPRRGRAARLVLVRARKGGRAALRLCDGWLLHEGAQHEGDQENHTISTASVLRDAAPLAFCR
jgi:tRNA1(Val) A37 N6-methylase TrmN6